MKQTIYLLLCFTLFLINGYSQPGTPDIRFADNGLFFDSSIKAKCNASLLHKDGKIVLGGYTDDFNINFFLMQLNNNGTIDSSFGNNGSTTVDIANFNQMESLAIQPDGKLIAAGSSYDTFALDDDFNEIFNMNISIVRYLPNGKIDSSFGENGILQSDLGEVEWGYSVAIQADGKIIVGGSAGSRYTPKFLVVRYMPNGDLDSSFGINGKVITVFDNIIKGYISKVLIDSGGSIFACGTISGQTDFALAKYLPNGTLDESFGTGGKVTTRMNTTGSLLRDAILLKDGKILTAGVTNYGNDEKKRTVLVQYNADGSLDESFGTGGKQEIAFEEGASDATCLAVQENGKIVFGAFINKEIPELPTWFGLVRCNTDGSLDSTFGTNAKVVEDFSFEEYPTEILLQNDGKIMVTGWSYETISGISPFAARYYGDPTHPLFTKIRRWIRRNILNFTDENAGTASYYIVEQQHSGGGFMPVASIASNQHNNYSYDISNHASANTNYRIKAVYADGAVAYSDAITASALETDTKVSISPNPASSMINISLKENKLQDGTVFIYDAMGNLVRSQSYAKQTKIAVNISSLRQGHYRVVVNSNGAVAEGGFLKE